MKKVLEQIRQTRVVPVLTVSRPESGAALARALYNGGMTCAEVTFRTEQAAACLEQMAQAIPQLCVGAGTILSVEQARRARSCGAAFMVTPAFNEAVTDYCLSEGLPVLPGVCTPYEVGLCLEKNLTFLKFFPAQASGGPQMLKALAGPFGGVEFMATGGISLENMAGYLALDNVAACGGFSGP